MQKIFLIPGWMKSLRLYEDHGDLDIRIGKLDKGDASADYIVGVSLGALTILQNIEQVTGKIILVNPPIPKRSILTWFIKWIGYVTNEGLFLERQKFTKNPIRFSLEIINCIKLLGADFSDILNSFPKERLIVIRGKNDRFFCDDNAVKFLHSKNIKLIEVEAGHNWSKETEKMMTNLTTA